MQRNTRKNRINWVWAAVIFGCLAFLGLQYFLVDKNKDRIVMEDAEQRTAVENTQQAEKGDTEQLPEVDAFLAYVTKNDPDDNGIFSNYTKNAFNHLTDALASLTEEEEIKVDKEKVESLKEQFEHYEQAGEQEKPKQLRNAMMATTGIIESMQVSGDNKDALEKRLESLKKSAQAIEVNTTVEQQSKVIEDYFEQAATVLEAIEESV